MGGTGGGTGPSANWLRISRRNGRTVGGRGGDAEGPD
jgi:hypothetical protein